MRTWKRQIDGRIHIGFDPYAEGSEIRGLAAIVLQYWNLSLLSIQLSIDSDIIRHREG
jgi:hypothetical protein